jgi:photosystem II stability/assembly factor-like uncharacterized protein
MKKNNIFNSLTTFIFYISILFFFIGFNFQDSRTGGWIRQYITAPIGGAQIYGIDFKDSLIGYAIANVIGTTDTSYVLKTTNGGYNWNIILNNLINQRMYDFKELNKDTLFVGAYFHIYRTYNGGLNWTIINIPGPFVYGIYVLNTDTMWYACPTPNGLYRTTNGGVSWQQQMYDIPGVNGYPQSIYMYNRNIGFVGTDNGELLKTTNSGVNWILLESSSQFLDIKKLYFFDSLNGYLSNGYFKKTTNGGLSWQNINLPTIPGSYYTGKSVLEFSFIFDTIYTVNSYIWYQNNQTRATVYKTTNNGLNWGYQIPDTSFKISTLFFTNFITGLNGWCYLPNQGLYTITGGDSTIYTGINNNITTISKDYILFQNYPNPFNQISNIKYRISNIKSSNITIKIFDITGRNIETLINKKQTTGIYEVKFDAGNLSSGIYFYTLFVDGIRIDTKKAVLIK